MKAKLAAGALAALVIALAGCGGGGRLSKSDYEQKLQANGQNVKSAFAKVSGSPSSLDQLAKQVGTAKDALDKAADDLDSANPPKDAEADNDKIVAALRSLSKEMDKLKTAADKGDAKLAQQVEQDIGNSAAVKDADAATTDLKKKGYQVGAFGE
jgi:hypothetical protein